MNNRTAWLHLIILLAAFSLGMVVDAYAPLWIKQKVIYPDVEVTDQDVVPRGVGRFDEHLGWALRPGARAISTATGEPVLYSINAEGLRDSPIPLSKPAGEFRILVLGDSRTFGFGVQLQDHFTTKLEAYFKNVQVINAGVNGYGLDQNLIMLRDSGLRFNPDIVLVYASHYGDHRHMHDVRFGHNKPRFRLLGEKLSLERSTVEEKLIAPIPPQSKELDQKDLEDPAFKEELHALGAALVREMQKVSQDQGAQFVLITEHERSLPHILEGSVMMLDVKAALNAQNLQLPKSLAHINASANTVLAWEIARFLQSNHLIPDNHRR